MRALATTALTAAALAVAAVAAPAAGEQNIVRTADASPRFDTLVSLVKEAGLAKTLAKQGPFTVFAPTDRAFSRVPEKTLAALRRDREQLRAVLLYHVVAGRLGSKKVVARSGAETLNGARVRFRVRDGKVFVNSARVVTADIKASNGVIHAINRVLIPPSE